MVQKMRVGSRCSRSRPRCSPIRPSPTASRTASCPGAREIWLDTDADRTGMTALRLRGRLRLRALCRLGARRADVFRQARRPLSRRRRRSRSATCSTAGSRRCPASGRRCRTGRTISRRCSPRCGSRTTSRCAAPTAGRGGASARCPPSGSGSSTTRPRSTAPGTSSRTGRRRSGRRSATRCRRPRCRRRSATAPSATSPATCWRSPATGLARRHRLNGEGMDETIFLSSLEEIVATGETPAEVMLREYETVWHGDVRPAFREYAF